MHRVHLVASLSLALIGLLLVTSPRAAAVAAPQKPLERYEANRLSMACVYSIAAYGSDAASLPPILDAAFDEVDRIDRLMSHYKPESPLSRINRDAAAGPVRVEPELFDFIAESLRYARESDGAFDITVGPLMKAWGFFLRGANHDGSNGGEIEGRIPPPRELADLRARVGYKHVVMNAAEHTIQFDRPGVELDLGGIAKGYAVDRAVAMLKARGVTSALVDACGSTMYAIGAPPDKDGWDVRVQDPYNARTTAMTLPLKDRALSVAGRSEKSFVVKGVTYSHIMDPRTAQPVQGMLTVIVLTDTGTAGDALDDVFFVQGVEKTRAQLQRQPELRNVEAMFLLPVAQRQWMMVRLPR